MSDHGTDDKGYAEVRRKLVERGYLQGPIERFLLRDLVRPGGGARRLARAGLKAALIGGPILGALLAGAAIEANRPLWSVTDAALLWLYLAVPAGAILFALIVGVAAIVAALARRRGARPSDVVRASLLAGLPLLGYLLLLRWEQPGRGGLAADMVFLVAALGATLLVAWLAGIVSLAGIVGRTGEVPDRRRRTVLVSLLALVPLGAAFLLLPDAGRRGPGPLPASAFEVEAGAPRLVLIGVDGLDGGLVEALASSGAVDSLLIAMQGGAVFPMRRESGIEPPEVWTTILTGMPAEVHGVRSIGAERLPGVATPLRADAGPRPLAAALRFLLPARTVPTSGSARRVLTFGEIVALKAPSASVGWWASWPAREEGADESAGYIVSDRVLPKLLADRPDDRDTAPESLFARLRSDFDGDRAAIRDEMREELGAALQGPSGALLRESFLIDAYALRVVSRLSGDPAVRASLVYLPGLDILRSRLRDEAGAPGTAQAIAQQAALEAYVRWLAGRLAEAAAATPSRIALVVADPGRAAGPDAEGFVLVTGERAAPACIGPLVAPLDVAPLALDLAGFPASVEMAGRVPDRCLEAGVPRSRVATFGRRGIARVAAPSAFDPEMVERLKSLGYLR